CNNSNQICLIAAHPQRAEFLYPSPSSSHTPSKAEQPKTPTTNGTQPPTPPSEANHYRPFLTLQQTLLTSLTHLLSTHPASTAAQTPSIALSGALTLALTHHNRLHTLQSKTPSTSSTSTSTHPTNPPSSPLRTRILLISLTGSLSSQYIPLTNTIFACQRLQIPISVAKLSGDAAFLEQACDSTRGTYLNIKHPKGMLQYLMMAFLSEGLSSNSGGGGGGKGEERGEG
ncbi:MAG: hypothetical protein Q9204_009282, partial [Flavoplaca sp. TL-2023a]